MRIMDEPMIRNQTRDAAAAFMWTLDCLLAIDTERERYRQTRKGPSSPIGRRIALLSWPNTAEQINVGRVN